MLLLFYRPLRIPWSAQVNIKFGSKENVFLKSFCDEFFTGRTLAQPGKQIFFKSNKSFDCQFGFGGKTPSKMTNDSARADQILKPRAEGVCALPSFPGGNNRDLRTTKGGGLGNTCSNCAGNLQMSECFPCPASAVSHWVMGEPAAFLWGFHGVNPETANTCFCSALQPEPRPWFAQNQARSHHSTEREKRLLRE